MKMGLVGYAGTGKSTVFEWLTGETPDPSKVQQGQTAMADVPDDRLAQIAAVLKPKKTTYTKVAVLDTPGLMIGEQKDNARRLGVIREANGMVIVLDGFTRTDFAEQLTKFREELLFADLEVVSNRVPKVRAGLKKAKPAKEREADEAELALLERVVAAFEAGTPASALGLTDEEDKALRSFQLLTLKPEIAFVNRGDSGFNDPLPADLLALEPHAVQAPVKLETELLALGDEDRATFMADLGVTEFRRAPTIRAMFYGVGREAFFTVGEDECRRGRSRRRARRWKRPARQRGRVINYRIASACRIQTRRKCPPHRPPQSRRKTLPRRSFIMKCGRGRGTCCWRLGWPWPWSFTCTSR